MDINYKEHKPPRHLADHIKSYWSLRVAEDKNSEPIKFSPVSDGLPGLIFQLAEGQRFIDELKGELSQVFVYGQTIKRRSMVMEGPLDTVGAFFYPDGLRTIFGSNANVLKDDCMDLAEMDPEGCSMIVQQFGDNSSVKERLAIMSNYFLGKIQGHDHEYEDAAVRSALDRIKSSNGAVAYPELLDGVSMTERTLERHFKKHVGISPKLYMRICRFQASLDQLHARGYEQLSDIAYDNGYSDQSHFIREFKEFLGFSPLQFEKKPDEMFVEFARAL